MRGLGPLEAAVMDVLWAADTALSGRGVRERLLTPRPLAYTTVMTILDNLHHKNFAQRHREGRGYRYRPAKTREQAAADLIRRVLTETGNPEAVLLYFASTASDGESKVLQAGLNRRQHHE